MELITAECLAEIGPENFKILAYNYDRAIYKVERKEPKRHSSPNEEPKMLIRFCGEALHKYWNLDSQTWDVPLDVLVNTIDEQRGKDSNTMSVYGNLHVSGKITQGERPMNLYFYAIVQTKKNGEYKSVEQYDIVAARDEDDAKMQALQRIVEMAEYDEALRTDRLKVVVRPF